MHSKQWPHEGDLCIHSTEGKILIGIIARDVAFLLKVFRQRTRAEGKAPLRNDVILYSDPHRKFSLRLLRAKL